MVRFIFLEPSILANQMVRFIFLEPYILANLSDQRFTYNPKVEILGRRSSQWHLSDDHHVRLLQTTFLVHGGKQLLDPALIERQMTLVKKI